MRNSEGKIVAELVKVPGVALRPRRSLTTSSTRFLSTEEKSHDFFYTLPFERGEVSRLLLHASFRSRRSLTNSSTRFLSIEETSHEFFYTLPFDRREVSRILLHTPFDRGEVSRILLHTPFDRGEVSRILLHTPFERGEVSRILLHTPFERGEVSRILLHSFRATSLVCTLDGLGPLQETACLARSSDLYSLSQPSYFIGLISSKRRAFEAVIEGVCPQLVFAARVPAHPVWQGDGFRESNRRDRECSERGLTVQRSFRDAPCG